jgi:hypothetical protein
MCSTPGCGRTKTVTHTASTPSLTKAQSARFTTVANAAYERRQLRKAQQQSNQISSSKEIKPEKIDKDWKYWFVKADLSSLYRHLLRTNL